MDGLLDWYLLGVALGLGVADGVAGVRRIAYAIAGRMALAGAVVIVLLSLPIWLILVVLAVAALAWLSFRRLSTQAAPAAFLAAAALAAVPLGGYLAALAAPLVGRRLERRAGSRYAGLRILAKD